MLDIIGCIEMEKLARKLKAADCFSIQCDGSVDKYGVDNKFITARFISDDRELVNAFLGENEVKTRRAEGLLDAIKLCFENLNIEEAAKEKFIRLTTDGEVTKTRQKTGLWAGIHEYLNRKIYIYGK